MRLRGALARFIRLPAALLALRPFGLRAALGRPCCNTRLRLPAALRGIERTLLAPQRREPGAVFSPRHVDTSWWRGAGDAVAFVPVELFLQGCALAAQPGSRRSIVGHCMDKAAGHHEQAGDQSAATHVHVSEVSTSRRASARYSGDCISASRDAVRTNSCASAPSV